MDEFSRIARFFAPLAETAEGAFGLNDDAAELVFPSRTRLVTTQDTLIETIHFFEDENPTRLAKKALRVNISDLAGKGAVPLAYFLSLSLPDHCDDKWVEEFAKGLREDQERYGITLMGGDSTSSPGPIAITITALGTCPEGAKMVRRGTAQVGDIICVTGTLGDAWLGLQELKINPNENDALTTRYHLPEPRLAMSPILARFASAAMDISDGLLQDLSHIMRASGVSAQLKLETIPISAEALDLHPVDTGKDLLPLLTGGDDYEILFTVAPAKLDAMLDAAKTTKIKVSTIGEIKPAPGGIRLSYHGQDVELPERLGYQHQE